jgi:hypothetical protein
MHSTGDKQAAEALLNIPCTYQGGFLQPNVILPKRALLFWR